ncbi:AmmeMemoRadiSam system protein A [Thermodesulfobacterium sp. TA1]|uniref:AmmeMemoRadiSam system protein A n=1 Tax=Thermodesulfobacterium sp. TA1 TaxID=2234087 RepID=UPI001232ACC7|nr:AmmeMemoRadiSam system protein A [Thermodesulfobacterium sp. TA1]QER41444.1 AmmeMemoRadiSam system protein A [Thermodesulfobacterium sp. TA1]
MLTVQEKIYCLKLARKTLENYFEGIHELIEPPEGYPALRQKSGAFVTLLKDRHLRGCIGIIEPWYPLYQVIQEMAISAAFKDPRFPPLSKDELPLVEIEISVLSPLKKGTIEEIEVGKHGIYLVKDFHRGVLLPQVPVEYGWDKKTFLEHVCLKAGLKPDCYKDKDVEFYLFTAEVFRESEFLK